MIHAVSILFRNKASGRVFVYHGCLQGFSSHTQPKSTEDRFSVDDPAPYRLDLSFSDLQNEEGAYATRITIRTDNFGFSFFLRDVNSCHPIYIPQYGVVVTTGDDKRTYEAAAGRIERNRDMSELEKIAAAPEESYNHCINGLRRLESPTWLGISRDIRIFEVGIRDYCAETWDCVSPRFFYEPQIVDGMGDTPVKFCFMAGRGIGCEKNMTRRLEEGVLPILNTTAKDGDILYHTRYFATNEISPLDDQHVGGTDMYVADLHGAGHMLTPKQRKHVDQLIETGIHGKEETVMYIQVEAVNTGPVPRYSFIRIPDPLPDREYKKYSFQLPRYDGKTGQGVLADGQVYLVATLNGKPVPQEEMCVMIGPGEKIEYIFRLPHSPISPKRAESLMKENYSQRLIECKRFWQKKLDQAAKIVVPEKRIGEMMQAGLLHIDLAYFGREPGQPVVPSDGVYTAIGSESSPGIQFLDSMNNCQLAERALQFFVEKQHEDGLIQNFGGYMLETGFALWTMGGHYRYGADLEWVRSISDSVKKACSYLTRWREKNLDESLKGKGYGMIDGKVADPDDRFHAFMLNSGAFAGLMAAADMLDQTDPDASSQYRSIAAEYRQDIRASLFENMAASPVIPLGNGRWIPGAAPWAEYPGPLTLYAEGGKWYSHGTNTIRDILGVQYLVLHGVIEPDEVASEFIVNYFAEFLCSRNVAFSQPYYSPHAYINLRRGEVKAFLSEFYNGFAALSDRDTYSFWEHFFHVSPHKLHEEAWFLMRCRWMLYLEDGMDLKLLPGIPRAWLEDGKQISVDGVRSYFGPLSFCVRSNIAVNRIHISVKLDGEKKPGRLIVRVPHPCEGKKAVSVGCGMYDADAETVVLSDFSGQADFEVLF